MCAAPTQRKDTGATKEWAPTLGMSVAGVALLLAVASWQPKLGDQPQHQQRAQEQTSHRSPRSGAAAAPKESDHSAIIGAAVGAGLLLAGQVAYRFFSKWWHRGSASEPEKTLVENLRMLLLTGYLSDLTFLVGDTQFKAHKAVLLFRCPGLGVMMKYECPETARIRIRVKDMEPDVMEQLLLFAYTDEVHPDPVMAQKLLVAAEKYGMSTLQEHCERIICQNLCVENAAACAVLAVKHSCERLTEVSVRFIAAHPKHVMATSGWYVAVRDNPYEAVVVTRLVAAAATKTRWL